MVSLELLVDGSSVGSEGQPKLIARTTEASPECRQEGLSSSQLLQLGSMGALVALGVLGGAGTAQAAVRRGAHCPAVNQLQVALGDRGYDVGAVDGKFGGRTEAAVRRFQKQQKLASDGIVGPATAQAMGLPPEFSCSIVTSKAVEPVNVPQSGTFSVATNGGALRLRQAPAGPVVGALKNGDSVTVVETANGWAKLRSGAWVSRAWLQVGGQAQAQQPHREAVAQAKPASVTPSERRTPGAAPPQTTVLTAIPGQVIELPSKQDVVQAAGSSAATLSTAAVAPTPVSTEAAVPIEVTAAPPQTGKIAITLPQAQPIVQSDLSASEQLRAQAITGQSGADSELRTQENVVIGAVTAAAPLSSSPVSAPTTSLAPQPKVADSVPARSLGIQTEETDSRTLLVAAVSKPIAAPQANAPESTTTEKAAVPKAIEPVGESAGTTVVSESPASESEGAAMIDVGVEVKPAQIAVRSAQQLMEVATYGDRLLVRDAPAGQVIGSVANGVKVSTIDENEGWYELESGGWVMARWLRR